MNTYLPRLVPALLAFLQPLAAQPVSLKLTDGRVLEDVTEAILEDGKVKVAHSGGTGRLAVSLFTADSQRSLGIDPGGAGPSPVATLEITRLTTLDGKTFEKIRSIRIKPSHISFVHEEGSASVPFEQLSEELRKQGGYDKTLAEAYEIERHEAEKAMALAEIKIARAKETAERNAARRASRNQMLNMMQMVNYGSTGYWNSSSNLRSLMDRRLAIEFQQAGFSPEETAYHIYRAKFR